MRTPNLFIIGASKAGSTTLHNLLAAHPQIFMSEFKDPVFFLGKTDTLKKPLPPCFRYRDNPKEYFALFAKAGERPVVGESSTAYTYLPHESGVSERIYRFNPQARLIYILRDPIERTISHYWWRARWEGETRDIMTAITQDAFYRDVSNYAMQLEPYVSLFGLRQIKVLTLEGLSADPRNVLAELFEWLSVDSSILPKEIDVRENVTPSEIVQLRNPGLERFRHSRMWDLVGRVTPRVLRRFGRKLVERRVNRADVTTAGVEEFLRPIQLRETHELSKLLGRHFPEWKTLNGNTKEKCSLDVSCA